MRLWVFQAQMALRMDSRHQSLTVPAPGRCAGLPGSVARVALIGDTGGIDRPTIIELARRSSGLTQAELARRAGTSQSTLSAYERRRKAPSLDVTERLMWAAGCDLGIVSRVRFQDHFARNVGTFYVPDRLWRVEVPFCFAKVVMPDLTRQSRQSLWDLRDREDRRRLYEMLLVLGMPDQIIRWVDGALLVDVWRELEIPKPVRGAWAPVVQEGSVGPTERASE